MADKHFDIDDPMELTGVALPGDTRDAMAEVFVEEFIKMGCHDAVILQMFQNPFYAAPHAVYRERGEAFVRDLIQKARTAWGGLGFRCDHPW